MEKSREDDPFWLIRVSVDYMKEDRGTRKRRKLHGTVQ
jgi:hypothetical protein